jgi:hypothetical protein
MENALLTQALNPLEILGELSRAERDDSALYVSKTIVSVRLLRPLKVSRPC